MAIATAQDMRLSEDESCLFNRGDAVLLKDYRLCLFTRMGSEEIYDHAKGTERNRRKAEAETLTFICPHEPSYWSGVDTS